MTISECKETLKNLKEAERQLRECYYRTPVTNVDCSIFRKILLMVSGMIRNYESVISEGRGKR